VSAMHVSSRGRLLRPNFFVGWNCHPCHSTAYRFSSDNASETQTPAGQQYPNRTKPCRKRQHRGRGGAQRGDQRQNQTSELMPDLGDAWQW
jgi:hypothetical protein